MGDQIPSPETDRISSLPDPILTHILSFLPTRDVIRTACLCTRWRFVWFYIHVFDFSFPDRAKGVEDKIMETIVLHTSPKITKFKVSFMYQKIMERALTSWVRYAIYRNVEEIVLDLRCLINAHCYPLPRALYSHKVLESLTLSDCSFGPDTCKKFQWESLKDLTMKCVEIKAEDSKNIVKSSPKLESLKLEACRGLNRISVESTNTVRELVIENHVWRRAQWDRGNHIDGDTLEISVPSVRYLDLENEMSLKKFKLENTKLLIGATFDFYITTYFDIKRDCHDVMVEKLLDKVQHVDNLRLGDWCIQVLSISELMKWSTIPLKCKCLVLDTRLTHWNLPGISRLLQASAHIDTLVINIQQGADPSIEFAEIWRNRDSCKFDHEGYWTQQNEVFVGLLCHLKNVRFVGFDMWHLTHDYLSEFAMFLLENAKCLEKMVFVAHRSPDFDNQVIDDFAKKLLNCPRSSPVASVQFHPCLNNDS